MAKPDGLVIVDPGTGDFLHDLPVELMRASAPSQGTVGGDGVRTIRQLPTPGWSLEPLLGLGVEKLTALA